MRDRSLLAALSSRSNGLNGVRLVLAFAVLVSHSFALTGRPEPDVGGLTLGRWAVLCFFAVSGYLITGSRLNLGAGRFVWHRALRIFPGYWLVCLVAAFVLAPTVAALRGESWSLAPAARYAVLNVTTWTFDPRIDGTLQHVDRLDGGSSALWNGATWTLPFELACYVVALAVLSSRRMRHPIVAGVLLVAATDVQLAVWSDDLRSPASFLTAFSAGMLLRLLGERVPLSWAAAGVAMVALAAAGAHRVVEPLGALPLAYLVLAAGAVWTRMSPRHRDLSYGVYIFAWPVQQIVSDFGAGRWPVLLYIVVVAVLVTATAWCSWTFVERPALGLKGWSPTLRAPGDLELRRVPLLRPEPDTDGALEPT